MSKIYMAEEINLDKLQYKYDKSLSRIFLKYDKKPLCIQTPEFNNENNIVKKAKYNELDVPLTGKIKKKVQDFTTFLKALDAKVQYDCEKNRELYFNTGEPKYKSIIRDNAIIKFKIIDSTVIFNDKKEPINIDSPLFDKKKKTYVKAILRIHSIGITEEEYGITAVVDQLVISQEKQKQYMFIEHDSDDEEFEDDMLMTEMEPKKNKKKEEVRKKEQEEEERKEIERKELEQKETERKEAEKKEMIRKELEQKETERKEAEKKEMIRKELEQKEIERKEAEKKEIEKKEIEQKETERKEAEKKEQIKQEIKTELKNKDESTQTKSDHEEILSDDTIEMLIDSNTEKRIVKKKKKVEEVKI